MSSETSKDSGKLIEPVHILQREFRSFDELQATVRHWNLDFRQTEAGGFRGKVLQFSSPRLLIADAEFGRKLHQRGVSPPGFQTIAIPKHPSQTIVWHGFDVGYDQMMVFPQDGGLDSASDQFFGVYTVSIPESILELTLDDRLAKRRINNTTSATVLRCDRPQIEKLRNLLSCLVQSAIRQQPDQKTISLNQDALIDRTIDQVVALLAESSNRDVKELSKKRRSVVEGAIPYIQRYANEQLTVDDVCNEIGVSTRTLQYAFQQCLGVTPKAYIQAIRLHGVHAELKETSKPGVSISDVAMRWGFWHMGDFAKSYRRHFGQLPSETIRIQKQ